MKLPPILKHYRTKKTYDGSSKDRILDISDELLESLSWWWENRPVKESEYVFCVSQKSKHYGKPYAQRDTFLRRLSKKAGVKGIGYHGLRRFVASLLDIQKAPLRKIQLILGHSKPTTTDLYIRDIQNSSRDNMRETMNSLSLSKLHQIVTPEKNEAGKNKK